MLPNTGIKKEETVFFHTILHTMNISITLLILLLSISLDCSFKSNIQYIGSKTYLNTWHIGLGKITGSYYVVTYSISLLKHAKSRHFPVWIRDVVEVCNYIIIVPCNCNQHHAPAMTKLQNTINDVKLTTLKFRIMYKISVIVSSQISQMCLILLLWHLTIL